MNITKISASRESWKRKAVIRNRELVAVKRKLTNTQRRLAESESKLLAANEKIQNGAHLAPSNSLTPAPVSKPEVRVICVSMSIMGVIPCNAVVRILKLLMFAKYMLPCWIPDPSSVVNWIARAGLGMLNAVGPLTEPWVAIIDTSISFGKAKALVVLRVPLSCLQHGTAPKLSDAQCIGLKIGQIWNGETVAEALRTVFGQTGNPCAILKDGGSDLAKGVGLLIKETPKIFVLQDIGHISANLLKAQYAKAPLFLKLLKLADSARKRLCQTDLSPLRPPKIRTKGRFQAISKLVEWADAALKLIDGAGRAKDNSLKSRLRKALKGLSQMRFFLIRFRNDCTLMNQVQEVLKNQGLNQNSYKKSMEILSGLAGSSKLRAGMEAWLKKHIRIHCQMSIGQMPLLVSSDIIESLMGRLKMVIERHPTPEFTTLSLATPLLCGNPTHESIATAITSCSHKTLTCWKNGNRENSNSFRKQALLKDLDPPDVPKTLPDKAA